jgi:5-methylcytosine-specific restriction endonuclease McrA
MTIKKPKQASENADRIIAEARRHQQEREKTYREQALKLYPWVCGRCAREFTLKNLRELTVHHKDHNHDNNPSDGSNWELLCLYCHDNEHSRYEEEVRYGSSKPDSGNGSVATFNPFANLDVLLKNKDKN